MHQIFLLLCIGFGIASAQTCLAGENGADGTNLTVTVVANFVTGCYTETFSDDTVNTLTICNGTSAGTCPPPVVSTVGQAPGCASISGQGSVLFCNSSAIQGATGATGATGTAGAVGPALTLTTANQAAGCVLVVGTGAATLCNGTSDLAGATGLRGPQGPAGANGANGTTGAAGSRGPTGLLPSYVVVDGTTYAKTTTGINLAIAAVSAAGGGTVYISGAACTAPTPCTPTPVAIALTCGAVIAIPSNVRLDLGGNTLQMPADSSVCNPFIRVGTSTVTTLLPSTTLNLTSAEGATKIQVALGAITPAFMNAVADRTQDVICDITGGFFGSINTAHEQLAVAISADNTTGIITLRDPLAATFPVTTAAITCTSSWASNPAIVNGILDANGNSGSGSYLLLVQRAMRAFVSRITFKGAATSGGLAPLWTFQALDSTFEHLTFDTISGYTAAAIRSQYTYASHFTDVGLTNSPQGLLQSLDSDYNIYSDLRSAQSTPAIGLQISRSSYNFIENTVVTNANDGLQFTSSSHHNVIQGLVVLGATLRAVNFIGVGDASNQIWGLVAPNVGTMAVFGALGGLTVGNYIDGELLPIVGAAMTSTAAGSIEPTFGNMARQTVNNNGFMAYAVHNVTATAADFVDRRQVIISEVGDSSLKFTVYNSAGAVVSTLVPVS